MGLALRDLPVEVLDLTLRHLPLADLLSFATTSRSNYQLAVQALTTLDLAIFPRKIHTLLAFFDATNEDDEETDGEDGDYTTLNYSTSLSANRALYQIGLATPAGAKYSNATPVSKASRSSSPAFSTTTAETSAPPQSHHTLSTSCKLPSSRSSSSLASRSSSPTMLLTPLSLRTSEITKQNSLAADILSSPTLSSLRHLSLRLYDLTSPQLSTILARQFPCMQTLSLDFSHPYIHDTTLPARYWRETPLQGSPVWNPLSAIGDQNALDLNLRNLRTLRLNRANITSFQLRRWIQANPDLRELRLSMCKGVDIEFTTWLADYISTGPGRGKLEIVTLHDCAMLELKHSKDFAWIDRLSSPGYGHDHNCTTAPTPLKTLSLRGCRKVNDDRFCRLATDNQWCRGIRRLVSPAGAAFKAVPSTRSDAAGRVEMLGDDDLATLLRSRSYRPGSVSPALTVSDGMLHSGADYFGTAKIEVDPSIDL